MAKLRIKNLKQVQNKIRRDITKQLRDPEIRKGVGEIVVDQIQKEPVPVTSKVTLAFREFLEQYNRVSSKYRRGEINITFTGELLNDLKNNVKAKFTKGRAEFVIEHSDGKHKNYKSGGVFKAKKVEVTSLKTRKTRKVTQKKSYKDISGYIIAKGYKYLTFSPRSKKRVSDFIKKELFKRLK